MITATRTDNTQQPPEHDQDNRSANPTSLTDLRIPRADAPLPQASTPSTFLAQVAPNRSLPTADQNRLIAELQRHVGYTETRIGPISYNKFGNGLDERLASWCGYFVNTTIQNAGLTFPNMAYVPHGYAAAKQQGLLRPPGERAQKGDVVFFDFDKDGEPEHTGIVIAVGKDGSVLTIEGNTSNGSGNRSNGDGVYQNSRRLEDILGFGVPQKK